ncbi:MAG: citrate synthase 2 [Chloroflexota bacterium]|nr:MAG: citrate synthase 2 [Chloroflexota bacterium]
MAEVKAGLQDVVVGQQDICFIDGDKGELVYRGYHIDELAPSATFEEVVYLLWHGKLPNKRELSGLNDRLVARRPLNDDHLKLIRSMPQNARPMSVCRTGVSQIGLYDPEKVTFDKETNLLKADDILAKMPTIMATFARYRQGLRPIPPREDLGHAANFLWMLNGKEPTPEAEKALDLYLVLLAEHDYNASTFACRVTASTWAGMYSAVVSGIGALSGHAHGGAVQEAMEQFEEIGNVDNVGPWFQGCLKSKKRIMGIGHRVYKALDPRAPHLRAKVEALAGQSENRKWFDIAAKLEEVAGQNAFFQERKLYPNVDYYSAPLLHMLGLDNDMFTPMFAISRIAGWCAHIMDQYADNRLIRPRADYVGPKGLKWTPLEDR